MTQPIHILSLGAGVHEPRSVLQIRGMEDGRNYEVEQACDSLQDRMNLPNASNDFRALNPHVFEPQSTSPILTPAACPECGVTEGHKILCKSGIAKAAAYQSGLAKKNKGRIPGQMNQTEREFSLMLEQRKQAGEFSEWAYEPFALPVEGTKRGYTPDFVAIPAEIFEYISIEKLRTLVRASAVECVLNESLNYSARVLRLSEDKIAFFEIKGGKIWRQNLNRYRQAVERYPWARFEMWQRVKREWTQIR